MGVSNDLLEKVDRIDTFEAGRDTVDGKGVAAKVREVETDGCETGEYLLKDDTLGW
mgnify:CR=1 FL=1